MIEGRRLRIEQLGNFARAALEGRGEARVLGVFDRSIHVVVGNAVVCIVDSRLGNGPLNAVLAPQVDERRQSGWTSVAAHPGGRAQLAQGSLTVGALRFDFADADAWQPEPWPSFPSRDHARSSVERLCEIAHRQAPAGGLAHLVLCPHEQTRQASPLARIAAPPLTELSRWLARAISHSADHEPAPTGLLGLGPGLTPSGDDLLGGALIALRASGHSTVAEALGKAAIRDAETATTQLSQAFLKAAVSGQGAEALHRLLAILLAGPVDGLEPLVDDVAQIGHTSGWDTLAGVAMALNAHAGTAAA
jgi:hypothetical protein